MSFVWPFRIYYYHAHDHLDFKGDLEEAAFYESLHVRGFAVKHSRK